MAHRPAPRRLTEQARPASQRYLSDRRPREPAKSSTSRAEPPVTRSFVASVCAFCSYELARAEPAPYAVRLVVLERVEQALGAHEAGGAQGLRRLEGLTATREEVDPAGVPMPLTKRPAPRGRSDHARSLSATLLLCDLGDRSCDRSGISPVQAHADAWVTVREVALDEGTDGERASGVREPLRATSDHDVEGRTGAARERAADRAGQRRSTRGRQSD